MIEQSKEQSAVGNEEFKIERFTQGPLQIEQKKSADTGRLISLTSRNSETGKTIVVVFDPEKQTATRATAFDQNGNFLYEDHFQHNDQGILVQTERFDAKGERIGIEDDLGIRAQLYDEARALGVPPEEAREKISKIPNAALRLLPKKRPEKFFRV